MRKLVTTVAGLAVMLAWWTIRGPGDAGNTEHAEKIPTVVWDGGAGSLTIHAQSTAPATLRISFSDHGENVESPRSLETWEEVPAGSHSWTIDVPAQVGGYVEWEARDPKPGDQLTWTLETASGKVDEQSDTLERPLEQGTAFFIQSYFDDYASGTLGDG